MKKVTNIKFRKHVKIIIFLSLICVVILSGCSEPHNMNNTTSTETPAKKVPVSKSPSLPEIKITYPSNATTVNMNETITGTTKNITNESEVWIVVHPQIVNKYYPISKVAIQNETWSLPIGIGSEKDTNGTKFDIIAVLADKKAQNEFKNYLETSQKNNSWPGMNKVPASAKEYDNITVTRNSTGTNPEIKITHPLNLSTVNIQENVVGTSQNISDEDTIWILVHPHTINKYYPQSEANIQGDGEWSLPQLVGIGSENDTGTQFDIIAVLADQKAQDEFKNYFDTAAVNHWPGMDNISDDATEYARVTVIRGPTTTLLSPNASNSKITDELTLSNGSSSGGSSSGGSSSGESTPTEGAISVFSSPNSSSIYLDGMGQGETPTTLYNIEQGSHNITLKLAGYKDWSQNVNVDAGKTTPINATLLMLLPEIKITYPLNLSAVHIQENIVGTSNNIPSGDTIWILVHPHKVNKYYPQNEANIQGDENWSLPQSVGIGSENDTGTKFDIIAVLADKKAQNEFKNYFDTAAVNHWPGINNIPDTAKVYDKITVTRV